MDFPSHLPSPVSVVVLLRFLVIEPGDPHVALHFTTSTHAPHSQSTIYNAHAVTIGLLFILDLSHNMILLGNQFI